MIEFKNIPEMVLVGKCWEFDSFSPGQSAWHYDDFDGKTGTVYILELQDHCKIGVSRNFPKRLDAICRVIPFEVKVSRTQKVALSAMLHTEAWLHKRFSGKAVRNEWFKMPASDAVAAMPEAIRFSKVYDRYSREWNIQNKIKWSQPHMQAKRLRDYEATMQYLENDAARA